MFIHLNFCIMAWLKVHTVLHQPETEVDEYLWWTQQNVWIWKMERIFFKLNYLIVTLVLPSQQFCKLWTHWGSRPLPSCPAWTPSWPSSSCPSSWCTCSTWTRSPPHLASDYHDDLENREFRVRDKLTGIDVLPTGTMGWRVLTVQGDTFWVRRHC